MTLMELFQKDTAWQVRITKIMRERSRLSYKRNALRANIQAMTGAVDYISMNEVRELQYLLHPDDPRRVPKQNMTRRRK